MKAIAVEVGKPDSLALEERDEPSVGGGLLVEAVAVGICGTDHEIIEGHHGAPPPGRTKLVLGHESVGRVVEAPVGFGFAPGDLVAGIVRRPDPEPCACCAEGRWDMCLNGRYVERGIKELDGYASERYVLEADFAVRVPEELGHAGVLVEPTSIVAKAWRRIDAFAGINCLSIGTVLVTGAGPIGLLAALLARRRDLEVHVLDRVEGGRKPQLVEQLGATYHSTLESCPSTDVVVEATAAPALIPRVIARTRPNSVVCLTGVSKHAAEEIDVGALNRELVLENDIVFGSVNAARQDYDSAVEALVAADRGWLEAVISRRVPLGRWREAYERREDDVKTVILF